MTSIETYLRKGYQDTHTTYFTEQKEAANKGSEKRLQACLERLENVRERITNLIQNKQEGGRTLSDYLAKRQTKDGFDGCLREFFEQCNYKPGQVIFAGNLIVGPVGPEELCMRQEESSIEREEWYDLFQRIASSVCCCFSKKNRVEEGTRTGVL